MLVTSNRGLHDSNLNRMYIPQDIVDLIVDQLYQPMLYETKHYLRATSLVSTTWVNRSQYHLFSTVEFNTSRNVKRWCCRIQPDPDGVSRHVRVLAVGPQRRDSTGPTTPLADRYIRAALPHLASFKNLQTFILGYTDLEDTPLGVLAPIFSSSAGSLMRFQWTHCLAADIHEAWKDVRALTDLSPNLAYVILSAYRHDPSEIQIRLSADEGRPLAIDRFEFPELRIDYCIPPSIPFFESCGPHLQVLDLSEFKMLSPSNR